MAGYSFSYSFSVQALNGAVDSASFTLVSGTAPTADYAYSVTGVFGSFVGAGLTGLDATFNAADQTVGLGKNRVAGVDAGGVSFDDAYGDRINIYFDQTDDRLGVFTVDSRNNILVNSDAYNVVFTNNVPCFLHGTLIGTGRGDVAVETLAIGDTVRTADGGLAQVKWLGRRSYGARFVAANPALQPVRIRAGALGAGLPRRDLLVSPKHAMLIDGCLVPAELLVNGVSIVRERRAVAVAYVHIELEGHELILAEGAAAETFVDDDSRGMFSNAAEYAVLYPGHPAPAALPFPRVESGFQLEAIRARLLGMAREVARAA